MTRAGNLLEFWLLLCRLENEEGTSVIGLETKQIISCLSGITWIKLSGCGSCGLVVYQFGLGHQINKANK